MSVNLFARWSTEAECLEEMLGLHDENSANAIVAGIKERITTNTLFKSADSEMIVLSKADDDEIVVIGPCSWEKVDPEDDLITAKAMSLFFNKWFNTVPERYQNITLNHKSFQAGIPLLKYQGADGEMYYTHVHEKGAILISKVRDDDGLIQTKDLREKILNGTYKSYSIYGVPIDVEKATVDDREVNIINDIDPGDVTYCRAGMNDMANFDIVKARDGVVQKPFADYDDFDDCVAQNQQADDPEAYCAAIQEQAEKAEAFAVALKGMTLEQINAKIAELRGQVEANQDRISAYYRDLPDTPKWVDELYENNSALYDELSAWREAKIERIVNDVKEEAAKTPSNVDKMLNDAFQPFLKTLQKKVDDIVVVTPTAPIQPQDLKEVMKQAFDESIVVLNTKIREKMAATDSKAKTPDERSRAMDEHTLETSLKVREIFKELKPSE